MAYGDSFKEFLVKRGMGKGLHYNGGQSIFLTEAEMLILIKEGFVVSLERGGLVIGKFHSDGGIHIMQDGGNGLVRYVGEMEGYEFAFGYPAAVKHASTIDVLERSIAQESQFPARPFSIPPGIDTVVCSNLEVDILFLPPPGGTRILSRAVSEKYLLKLNELNRDINPND